MLYIVFHNVFHGKVFISLLFATDTVFEIIYAVFPLIYFTSNDDSNNSTNYSISNTFDLRSLGLLKSQNFFITFQSLFAIVMLARKCFTLLSDLNPTIIAQRHWNKLLSATHHNTIYSPWIIITTDTANAVRASNTKQDIGTNDLYYGTMNMFDTDPNVLLLTAAYSAKKGSVYVQNQSSVSPTIQIQHSNKLILQGQTQTQVQAMPDSPTPLDSGLPKGNNEFDIVNFEAFEVELATPKHSKQLQDNSKLPCTCPQWMRKLVVLSTGLGFICVGISAIVIFWSFIENEYNHKCLYDKNTNQTTINETWFDLHPELRYYNQICKKQVINVFNKEYPCNCRQFRIAHESERSHLLTQNEFEASLSIFDDLEGIFFYSVCTKCDSATNNYNLTKSMFDKLEHLQVLVLITDLNYIHDNDVIFNNLKNLEILSIISHRFTIDTVKIPFDSIGTTGTYFSKS